MTSQQVSVSPIDGSVVATRPYKTQAEINGAVESARKAQAIWAAVPIAERAAICTKAVDAFAAKREQIGEELTRQIGRPIGSAPGEVDGFVERATYMIDIGEETLADIALSEKEGFERFITREPLGVAFIVAAWNYPYLIAVNAVIPAIMAGNAVLLRHSAQTQLCAERIAEAFTEAGLPDGVFQVMHITHDDADALFVDPRIDAVGFTGSNAVGQRIAAKTGQALKAATFELGGKDPAYVRADADLEFTVPNLVDGAFFNSGQSCCAVERIYVHEAVYDEFVRRYVELAKRYRLGDPFDQDTNIGPMINAKAADFVRGQIADALTDGATLAVDPADFDNNAAGTPYLAPSVLLDVTHDMRIMTEESFGPTVGIMKVASDDEAIKLMNDSEFGLTASVWTPNIEAAKIIGDQLETGTFFVNRSDYADPALAWNGVKNSGVGCTLSRVGYENLTRPKSYHIRTNTQ